MSLSPEPFRILLVEDNPDDRFFITLAITQCEIDASCVMYAEDGDDALELLVRLDRSNSLPDLMLLDLNMPRMSGHELLELLRREEILPKMSVMVLTTSRLDDDVRRVYEAGAHSYIVKPHKVEALVEVVECIKSYMDKIVAPSALRLIGEGTIPQLDL